MLSGIDLAEVVNVSSSSDSGEIKTVFKISPISSRVQARIGKLAGADGGGALDSMIEAFRFGVKDIQNLLAKNGSPIAFKTEECLVGNDKYYIVSREIMDLLPLDIIAEIGSKIVGFNNLSEQERKN
jgi:hypothetical protein